MKNYLDLMNRILEEGDVKEPARENLPRTKELFCKSLEFNLQDGFPLLTTKKMFTKGIIGELLWFLRGSTQVDDLISRGINIWNEDCYKFYSKKNDFNPQYTYDEWVEKGKENVIKLPDYNAGKIYGYHWRKWGKDFINMNTGKQIIVDQIFDLVKSIIETPNSRYQLVTSWNPTIVKSGEGALPSCHVLFQTNVRNKKYLDLAIYQRSCDFFAGVPFNISSYAFLIHILCELTGLEPGVLTWTGGSIHIYENQVDACNEQLQRTPKDLPKLSIYSNKIRLSGNSYTSEILDEIFNNLTYGDFIITNYNPHPTIKAPLSTGLKLDNYKKIW
jgi:thymidylate synthase